MNTVDQQESKQIKNTPKHTVIRTKSIVDQYEREAISKIMEKRGEEIPQFRAGDDLIVEIKIPDLGGAQKKSKNNKSNNKAGKGVPEQRYKVVKGVCIARRNRGLGSSFLVRNAAAGLEMNLPLYGPTIKSITVVRRGKVRRAKLYYLRNVSGKKARIKELAPKK